MDCPVREGCLGRCLDASGRVVGYMVSVSCVGGNSDYGDVGGLLPRVCCRPKSRGESRSLLAAMSLRNLALEPVQVLSVADVTMP